MKSILKVITCSFLLSFSSLALAHPPKDIKMSFDASTNTLKGKIFHRGLGAVHAVKRVKIFVNNKELTVFKFRTQTAAKYQAFSMEIPSLNEGDEITVVGHCNLWGSRSENLKL